MQEILCFIVSFIVVVIGVLDLLSTLNRWHVTDRLGLRILHHLHGKLRNHTAADPRNSSLDPRY